MSPHVKSKIRPAIIGSVLIMAAEHNIMRATVRPCLGLGVTAEKKKHTNTSDSNVRANSTSPKIILYMGDPCCHSMQLTGWAKIRIWWGAVIKMWQLWQEQAKCSAEEDRTDFSISLFPPSGWQLNIYHMQYLFSSCVRLSSCPREYKECHLLE